MERREPNYMGPGRVEAFSDGVIAVIITIMVLELKAPKDVTLQSLESEWPVFLSYLLSFTNVGIYWNNHHHLLRAAHRIDAKVMWANLHLLFWLSLIPFFTSWVGQHYEAIWPTVCYGAGLLGCAVSYFILQGAIINAQGPESKIDLGSDIKGKVSLFAYLFALPGAFLRPWIADVIFLAVALIWFVPDRRLTKVN